MSKRTPSNFFLFENPFVVIINTSKKMRERMKIAALTTSLVYLLKKEWKKQCLIMKNYCMILFLANEG
jgi:hypothetical protein